MLRWLALISYLATIPAANWLIGNAGTVCVPDGPCLIPVWPGVMAPSGVLLIGLALVLRDAVQEFFGLRWTLAAIAAGVALSAAIAPPALVVASAAAFLIAELLDLAVYTPLRQKSMAAAILASGLVGALADSAVFLMLAFGSLSYLPGQWLGKLWMSLLVVAFRALPIRRQA